MYMHVDRKAKLGFENLKMGPSCRHEAVNGSLSVGLRCQSSIKIIIMSMGITLENF